MLIDVKVPALSESITDGTLINWHKKPGEFVQRDENLVDLETDKVVLEIVAPKDGVLQEINKGDGELVASEEVIATINDEAKSGQSTGQSMSTEKQIITAEKMIMTEKIPEVLLSPAAKKLVSENNIDPTRVSGTGRDNRVTKADIIHYLETRGGGKKHEETT
ncbi:MAG: dihydrolipoamide succinyltransferase, partial [Gammaproteobacteria bacterium]|nr:dihydrolipoamide succinyltransferase [Gammaproteobacteria bacterium]